jgi:hypothetical protein
MKLKNFNQYLTESVNSTTYFQPHYFNLPYSIPEDRFKDGLLKSNTYRKTSNSRSFSESKSTYSSIDEFLEKNPIAKIEKSIMAEVNKVIKFINNNKLTGKELDASFSQEMEFSEYLDEILETPEEDIPFGIIETGLPFSTFSIRVDYDIYKNIPVFTFWYDGDLFYYYGVFTLESNDVSGSGENHTYITSTELIDYLFYETVWRAAISELKYLGIEPVSVNVKDEEFDRLSEITNDPNYSNQIVKNYFDKNFIQLLKRWIKNDDPTSEDTQGIKFNYKILEEFTHMSFPGDAGTVLSASSGPYEFASSGKNSFIIRLLSFWDKEDMYLAIRFIFNSQDGLISIESADYSTSDDWNKVDWKQLTQAEINTLYVFDKRGKAVWIQNLMN